MIYKHELVEEFKDEIVELGKIEVGSEKYKTAVDGVTKMATAISEIERIENQRAENEIKLQMMESENELKKQQMADEKKDRKVKNGIAIGTFVSSAALYGLAYWSSMRYESKGVFPTTEGGKNALRNLLNKLKG